MELNDIVRIGTVSSVNAAKRTARVTFRDRGNMVSAPLYVLQNQSTITVKEAMGHTHEITVVPWMPRVGQTVVCLYQPNGESDGYILGGI